MASIERYWASEASDMSKPLACDWVLFGANAKKHDQKDQDIVCAIAATECSNKANEALFVGSIPGLHHARFSQ